MLVAYLDAIGKDLEYSEDYEVGIKWAFLRDDLMAALRMMLDGDLSSGEWISSLRGKKEYDTYSWDDLRPFLMSLPSNILRALAISK